MTRKYFTIIAVLLGFVGCRSYKDEPYVVYLNNEIEESIIPKGDYCIYDNSSNMIGTADYEMHVPAHYQMCIPPKKDIKKFYRSDEDRCILYSKSRGIAIFQDITDWERKYASGFRPIATDTAEKCLSWLGILKDIKVNGKKNHYLYVDHEIRILFFNLSQDDYHSFVELPLKSLDIKRRGAIWSTYSFGGYEVQIKVQPSHVQRMNDGHGPSYVLSTSKGYFVITDAGNTEFDFDEYEIIRTDTINGIYSTYGVHNDKYFRKDSRPISNKSSCRIYYADVMAKDTCECNRIMDNVIIAPRQSNPIPQ